MHRRGFLAGSVALASLAGRAWAEIDDLRTAAREAWRYSLPLIETARARQAAGAASSFTPFGPDTTGPGEPGILRAAAWLEVAGGSASLRAPPSGGRYLSVTLFDMYTNVLAVLTPGPGDEPAAATIIGPAARMGVAGYTVPEPRLPPMHKVIKAREPWVWALARIEVAGDEDTARTLMGELEVKARVGHRAAAPSTAADSSWSDYFYAAQRLIDESPPPVYEADFFRRIASLQLGMAGGFERARFADADLAEIAAGAAEGRTLAVNLTPSEGVEGGWLWPVSLGPDGWGQDFLARARTSLDALGAPGSEHLLSLRAVGSDGRAAFAAAQHYRLTLPAPPPAQGPWSVALYPLQADGRLGPAVNEARRHAIGARTPDLRWRPSGEIDIWIGQTDPGGAHSANWLPAPDQGEFAVVFRAYRPGPDLLGRRYRPLPVQLLSSGPDAPPQGSALR